jgi:hypothetical protein
MVWACTCHSRPLNIPRNSGAFPGEPKLLAGTLQGVPGTFDPIPRNTPPGPGSQNAPRPLQWLGSMMCLTKVAITGVEIDFQGHHHQGSGRTPLFRASTRYERGASGLETESRSRGGGGGREETARQNE